MMSKVTPFQISMEDWLVERVRRHPRVLGGRGGRGVRGRAGHQEPHLLRRGPGEAGSPQPLLRARRPEDGNQSG